MIDEQALRQGLQRLLKETESAIRERLSDGPSLEAQLRERHSAAVRAERTEGSAKGYNAFADEAITQAAVHWLLGCAFVRFLEDNGWLDERNAKVAWIAGTGERLWVAKDRRTLFLRPDPNLTDRDYLLHVFAEVAKLPGAAGLFDKKHNPLYLLQPTGQGAAKIVDFFQRIDPDSNRLIHDFTDQAHGTRFLGDLYQNLSESARKRYALCQTPGFVIDFILDRTLTPALDAFGLETVRMIDPSCGSGHFLLASFGRLFRAWQGKEPGTNPPTLVQRALSAVYGVDLNPFAVEISRFRLLIAALESSGIERLADAPDFRFNVAAGDSLLHGSRVSGGGISRELFEDRLQHFYDTEDAEELKRILGQKYHAVVGNPPYINVSDAILREAYRTRFETCHGKYQLGVPFTERFFDLTLRRTDSGSGFMGMIVSNAFMKRTFGKKLIEDYLSKLDLTHVIDTSGVYLPGHGTPTVILFGRNQEPVGTTVRAVRGIRGEVVKPEDPACAPVWLEIATHLDQPGFEGHRVSVVDASRASFSLHPWSIGGGGATELKELLGQGRRVLREHVSASGFASFPGQDEAFFSPARYKGEYARPFATGETCRDWQFVGVGPILTPYDKNLDLVALEYMPFPERFWLLRRTLASVGSFGNKTIGDLGLPWWGWYRWIKERYKSRLSIAFGHISTHNHFVFDRGERVFNQHSPVIKLNSNCSEEEYITILGLLNTSIACFWLKQVCHSRGTGGIGGGLATEEWEQFYEIDSTKLLDFPLPNNRPTLLATMIQNGADLRTKHIPGNGFDSRGPVTSQALEREALIASGHLSRMVTLQEELDWHSYYLYGLVQEDLVAPIDQVPQLRLGERAFEIRLARIAEDTTWFDRHRSTPITEVPAPWPEAYRQVVERRIAIIETDRNIALIERPEYKRRWNLPAWEEMESAALKNWLLDRIEANEVWKEHRLYACAQLRDALSRDLEWLSVAEIYHGRPLEDLDEFVTELATPEAVPFLPILRYTETGLRKRGEWEQVWKLQREEDGGANVEIPVPPKYASKDFQKSDYWRLRGGLDVPKERFMLYPGFQRDSDETPVLGWAGWSHLEQAKALAAYYQRMRNEEGWEPERLKPILAGLLELREWLKQWHDDAPDPETGLKLGTYFSDYAEAQCQELGFSTQEVLGWKPVAGASTGRRNKSKTK